MTKRIYSMFLLFFAAIFLLAAPNGMAETAFRAGVADVARLMKESVPGKEGIKYLESQQQKYQKELDVIQDRLEKDPTDEASMKELQQLYTVSQQRIQAEGQNVASLIFDTVQKVLDNYRAEKGLDVILSQDTIASFDPKIDITSEIMAILDKQKIEFKPLPEPAKAPLDGAKPEEKKDGANNAGENAAGGSAHAAPKAGK